MKRNYKKEYDEKRIEAKRIVKEYGTYENFALYLTLTKYGAKVFRDLNKRLYKDTEIDLELGIISEEEAKIDFDTYNLIENSIANACIY